MFDNDWGRCNTNNNLRERWRRSKSASKYSDKCEFLHEYFVSSCEAVRSDDPPQSFL